MHLKNVVCFRYIILYNLYRYDDDDDDDDNNTNNTIILHNYI